MTTYENTIKYFEADFPRQLFPLDTNKVLIVNAAQDIGKFIYECITHEKGSTQQFLPQVRAYSSKHGYHLRRTLKLDPIAEFFFYDITYRNRAVFKRNTSLRRRNYGYRFSRGQMLSPAKSYRSFRKAVNSDLREYKYCVKVDIAQYFNSLYHHDLIAFFRNYAKTTEDTDFLSKFLRQINSGRSVDCLPHGIYPAKIIGSQFLRFLEESNRLNANQTYRFMDDIYLFDNKEDVLRQDFHQLQRLLGEKGLSVNASKTLIGEVEELDINNEIDEIKSKLLMRRGAILFGSGAEEDFDLDLDDEDLLNEDAIEYLLALLKGEHIEEEDAELVLAVMRDHSLDVLEYIPVLLQRFPSLIKNIFYFSEYVEDANSLLSIVIDFLEDSVSVSEYQLFWLAKLCEKYLLRETNVGDVLARLFEHSAATSISKAKILEIPVNKFGMPDLREEELRTGESGWLSWSSAVGSRKIKKANRNHLLGYFGNGSPLNQLISDCVRKL